MKPSVDLLPAKDLQLLLTYDANSGRLQWLQRPREMFSSDNACNSWNAKWAGKPAFTAVDGKGYFVGAIYYRLHRAHRVIWALNYGEWPGSYIDHINGDKQDNRIENLRVVSHRENMLNAPRKSNNTSGTPGVSWNKRDRKWSASIKHNGRAVSLGYFWTKEAAVRARKSAEVYYGYHSNHGRALA